MQPFKYQPKVNTGKLRNRVKVYGKVEGTNELKHTVYNDALITSVWANVIPQTGKLQSQQANTILTNVTHKIEVRYNKVIMDAYQDENVKSSLHIKFRGHRFDVKYILNPYFKNETLEIFCEEVIG